MQMNEELESLVHVYGWERVLESLQQLAHRQAQTDIDAHRNVATALHGRLGETVNWFRNLTARQRI